MPDPLQDIRYSAPAETGSGIAAADMIAVAVSVVWLALVSAFFFFANPGDGTGSTLSTVMILVAVFMPLALIWVAAVTARQARAMRAEATRLQAALDAMRQAYLSQAGNAAARPSVERKLDEIAAAQRQTESTIAAFASRRDATPSPDRKALQRPAAPATPSDDQPALALGPGAEQQTATVSVTDFIRALNFPDTAEDAEGFRALRRALDDRNLAKLVRAAQDVLTLLSQDGIYMDDLRPDRARPEVWRRFATGERGKPVAGLGGVRDRSSLALSAGRMKQDTVFRDAAHHFLRQFDRTFIEFEKNATDQEISDFAETRTARAFMLLGRVTGIFD
ncbi:MAG: hypothetical protein RLZZ528_2739 [Pseudomonadota bacterium]|jgi:Tfp pilus assembly protein PilE